MKSNEILAEFRSSGRFWFRDAVPKPELAVLEAEAKLEEDAGKRVQSQAATIDVLSKGSGLGRVMGIFGNALLPVRVVAFNKTKKKNWGVPWHQDRVVSVAERHDVPTIVNWSRKSGVWHCEPPAEVLNQMFFVRVHLDDAGPDDGAMRIAVGSYKAGIVPSPMARDVAETYPIEDCQANRGDVLVLKMLTLHSLQPSLTENERRVFRVDYAPAHLLPAPLSWHQLRSSRDQELCSTSTPAQFAYS